MTKLNVRSKAICAAALCIFGSITVLAQTDDPKRTVGLGNGRMWATMDDGGRLYYVIGLLDGLAFYTQCGTTIDPDRTKFICKCTNGEIVQGITTLYASDPVYARIPIVMMLRLNAQRANGATKAEIDKDITDFLKSLSKGE